MTIQRETISASRLLPSSPIKGLDKYLRALTPDLSQFFDSPINGRINPWIDWMREWIGRTEVVYIMDAQKIFRDEKAVYDDLKFSWGKTLDFVKNMATQLLDVPFGFGGNVGASDIYMIINNALKTEKGKSGMGLLNPLYQILYSLFLVKSTDVYRFRINPIRALWNFTKIQTKTSYGWGVFDLEDYGDEMIKVTLENTTGYLVPPEPLPRFGIFDLMLTAGYYKLKELEDYYLNSKQSLLIHYFRNTYHGWLTGLNYTHDANNPFQITFTLNLELHPLFRIPLFGKERGFIPTKNSLNRPGSTLTDAVYPVAKPVLPRLIPGGAATLP